jgi:undecaprenyl-diphosphatase
MIHYVSAVDHNLMRRANWWRAPRWIRVWMILATRGGNGGLWFGIGLAALLFGGEPRFTALLAAGLSAACGILLFMLLKRLIRRERPCAMERHCWASLLPPDQFSFPSGHSITAFAVTVPLAIVYPSLFAGLMFCALSVAASRVLLGMHYLSDVVVGALIGAMLGFAACAIVL